MEMGTRQTRPRCAGTCDLRSFNSSLILLHVYFSLYTTSTSYQPQTNLKLHRQNAPLPPLPSTLPHPHVRNPPRHPILPSTSSPPLCPSNPLTQSPQSFIGGIVAFRALPRPQFSQLQQAIFPIYFALQTSLPVLLALTYPGSNLLGSKSSIPGVLEPRNRGTLVAIGSVFVAGVVNMVYVGPETTRIMRARKVQGMFFSSLLSPSISILSSHPLPLP